MLNKTCPTQEENVPAMLKVKKLAGGGKYSQVSSPLSSSFERGVLNTQHLYMILPNPNNLMSLAWPYLTTILVST